MTDEVEFWRERHRRERAARLAAEQLVEGLAARLEDRLAQVHTQTELDLLAQKSHFLSVVSHELRTPVTILRGGLHVLRRENGDSPGMAQVLGTVERATIRLMRIVQNVEMSARLRDRENVWPRSLVDFGDLANKTIELAAPDSGVRVRGRELTLVACAELLHVAVCNLVNNAVVYGRPPVELSAEDVGGGVVEITVTDGGSGLPPGHADLFKAFAQGDSGDDRTSHGLGLGLSVVVDAANAAGWSLDHDVDDRGASFRIRVPNPVGNEDDPAVRAEVTPGAAGDQARA